MELEVKGFIQFCRFLSQHPDRIANNKELEPLLDFCFDAVMNCDCHTGKLEKTNIYETRFEEKFKSLSAVALSEMAHILDSRNNFSEVFVSFPISGEKIKVK